MSLSATALITVVQAKNYIRLDAASSLTIAAEYVGAGDGAETVFTLDNTPISGSLKLYLNNVLQVEDTAFTLSTATVTFTVAPTNTYPVTASYEYSASDNTFEAYDDDLMENLINAATKKCEDYTGRAFIQRSITSSINGTGTDDLRIPYTPMVSITSVAYKKVVSKTGDATTVAFALGATPKTDSLKVYLDGTLQSSGYTLASQTVTFDTAPTLAQKIVFRFEVELDLGDDYTESLHLGRLHANWAKDYEYVVVYTSGYGATRATAQASVPDAVMAVLSAVGVWHENRMGLKSENVTGVGAVVYGDTMELPAISKGYLSTIDRNLL